MRNIFLSLAAILIASLIAILPTQIAFANEESEKHNLKGNELHNAGNYEAAIKEYKQAIDLDSSNPVYYANIGWSYYFSKDYVNAEAYFKKAPNHSHACNGLAHLYYDQRKYTDAITNFTKAIKSGGGTAEVYDLRGRSHFYSGNYDAAIKDFTNAIDLDKNYADAYSWRATVYQKQGKNDAATTDFMDAGWKYIFLGQYADKEGNYTEAKNNYTKAEKQFENILQLNPKHKEAYYGLGKAYSGLSNWQAAIDNYTNAIDLKYVEDFVYTNCGYAKYRSGDYDAAIKDFTEALNKDVTHAEAYIGLGESYLSLTKPDYKKAKDAFEQYLKLNRKNLNDEEIKYYEDKIKQCEDAIIINDPTQKLKGLIASFGLGEVDNFLKALLLTMGIYSAVIIIIGIREKNSKYIGTFIITNAVILLLLMLAKELDGRNIFIVLAVGYMLIELLKKAELLGIPVPEWIKNLLQKFTERPPGR